jgi:hypothetical protein
MHARDRQETQLAIGVFAHFEFKNTVKEDAFGGSVLRPACDRARIAPDTPLQIDHHPVSSHYSSPEEIRNPNIEIRNKLKCSKMKSPKLLPFLSVFNI